MNDVVERWNPTRRIAIVLVAGALGVAGLSACTPETSGPESGITVKQIQNGREGSSQHKYAGKKVTVSADVNRIFGPHAFSIAGTASSIEPLLVLHDSGIAVSEGDPIKVTGVVRTKFDMADVEGKVEYEFDHDVFKDFNGAPYLKATSIKPKP